MGRGNITRRQFAAGIVAAGAVATRSGSALGAQPAAEGEQAFTNPVGAKVADPCVIRVGDLYYLYGTLSIPGEAEGMPVWSSPDLVRWRDHGLAYRRPADGWGTHWFWGPDVKPVADGYLMYYGAFRELPGGGRTSRICVARSPAPTGPFIDVKAPMFDWPGRGDAIDAFAFTDSAGNRRLFFTDANKGHNTIWVAPLSADGLSLSGEPKQILQPDQPWEIDPVNEGAFVWERGGRFWMMFSVNDFRNPAYGMGLATAPALDGPWTKRVEGPIIRQAPGLRGPGCAGLIPSPDGRELWAYYHVHLQPDGAARQLAISRATYAPGPDGREELRIEPPTTAPQPLPSGSPANPAPTGDPLTGTALNRTIWTVIDEIPANIRPTADGLIVRAADGDMWRGRGDYRNLILQPPIRGNFEATIELSAELNADFQQAFLIVWQDADTFVRIGRVHAGGQKLSAAVELNAGYEERLAEAPTGGVTALRIRRRGDIWTLMARAGDGWHVVGSPREARLPLPRAGFGAITPGDKRPFEARFRNFTIERLP